MKQIYYGIASDPLEYGYFPGQTGFYPSFSAGSPYSKNHDMLVQVLTDEDYITIEYFVRERESGKDIISTKVRTLKVED